MIWALIVNGIAAVFGALIAADTGHPWIAMTCGVLAGMALGIALVKLEEVMP